MDELLDERFNRLETALNVLIESITTANPSISATHDLIVADDSLSEGLTQLAQHQSNHARILQLRQTADALNDQIKLSMRLLADTRKELLSIPFEEPDTEARDVPFDELLSYAKRISRFTLPANFRPAPQKPEDTAKQSIEGEDVIMANGTTASPLPISAAAITQDTEAEKEKQGAAYAALSDAQREWLDHMSRAPFIPWPNEEDMKRGALVAVQTMLAQGQDPSKILSLEEQEELDRKLKEESAEEKLDVGRQRRSSIGRAPAPVGVKEETQPAFDFGLYNPEDDEEDE